MLFSGKKNSIFMTREYYNDYSCDFDLRFYPFDTQVSCADKCFVFGTLDFDLSEQRKKLLNDE